MLLFSELVGQFPGPILVIGGGPSVPAGLKRLKAAGFAPVAVLSANEHGHHQSEYEITHSVCCDGIHGERRISMEKLLGIYGKPIITPAHFGHFRLPDWTLAANSGLTAVCCAVFMGGHPVVVVGIDFYRTTSPDVYFHDPKAISNSTRKVAKNFQSQVDALVGWVGARAPIRPMVAWPWGEFPAYREEEIVAPQPLPVRAQEIRKLPRLMIQTRPFPRVSFKVMQIEPGRVWPVSPNEARSMCNNGWCKLIETHPAPGETTVNLPPNWVRSPSGYAQKLLRRHQKQR